MSRTPRISIVVPVHNCVRFVARTLESIRAQTFVDWECVVVDDGSSDGTGEEVRACLKGDRRFRMVGHSNAGASVTRNRGFFETNPQSSYLTFMDGDDCWEPDALWRLLERLEASPEAVGAHGLADFVDASDAPLNPGAFAAFGRRRLGLRKGRIIEWPLGEPTVFECLVWTGPVYPPGVVLARRDAYERAGLFDPQLRHCEDWDMCLRLSRLGPIEFVNRVLLRYRRHGGNQSNDEVGSRDMVRRVHRKAFFSPENTAAQQAVLREGWRAWQCFKVRENWEAVLKSSGTGRIRVWGRALAAFSLHAVRYAKGAPGEGWI